MDKRWVVYLLQAHGKPAVIPSKRNCTNPREHDKELYKARPKLDTRHLIENFFAKLKQHRAIAICCDGRAVNFLAAICLFASVIWLN